MGVSGEKDKTLGWKSSCGGYAFTVVDGNNENIEFKCQQTSTSTARKFYIADVQGIKAVYSAGEQLNLIIKGVESDGTPATDEEGFNIQFYIDEWPLVSGQGSSGDNAQYREGYWYGSIKLPDKVAYYRLQIALYCSRDDSTCAKLY